MTVKELKQAIASLPDDMEIIVQKDPEGNGFSPLGDIYTDAVYIPDSTWSGDVYWAHWSAEDAAMDEEEWAEMRSKPKVLVLTPIN